MKQSSTLLPPGFAMLLFLLILGSNFSLTAQQTDIRQYIVFGGDGSCPTGTGQTPPPAPGCAVQISSSTKIQGGSVGSYTLVKSTGNTTINANIFSGGTIQLANSNIVGGRISAANSASLPGTILSVGSSASISGNVDVNGNIVIGGGTVSGVVTHPPGTTYYLGNRLIGNTDGIPNLPILPALPPVTSFPAATDSHITGSQSIDPGSYGDIKLTGNQKLTFNGPGVYVFKSILNTGNANTFIYDFQNDPSGVIKIYVHGNADLGKISTTLKAGGAASRIFVEGHGTGPVAVDIANGSSGQGSKWLGTVWAPYGAINVGSGTGSSTLTGAFWSGTQVNLQSGVSVIFDPIVACTPVTAEAGPDQTGAATCGLTTVTLAAKAPSSGTGSWSIINGTGSSFGDPSSNVSEFSGTAGGTYTLRWNIANGTCGSSTDDVVITFNQVPNDVSAGADKALEFSGQTSLLGSTAISGASFNWQATNGGVISSATNTLGITVSSQGTYNFTVTSAAGCSASDLVNVTSRLRNIIGSELQSIYDNKTTDNTFFDIKDGYVKIDIIALEGMRGQVLNRLLEDKTFKPGLRDTIPNGLSALTITGRYFIDSLPNLNNLADLINYVRPYYRAILFSAGNDGDTSRVGLVRSAGDTAMKSHLVRSGYSVYGDGIRIGVISDSYGSVLSGTTATLPLQPVKTTPYIFSPVTLDTIGTVNPIAQTFNTNTAAADIINRDLPPNVHLLPIPNLFPVTGTDEGRAMMQIVHDVAPGAELFFRSGFLTAGDFAKAIVELKDAGCKIIVDDITYPTEPILRDGIVARTVNDVKSAGVTYFSSAGNFGNKSYEKNFNPMNFNGKVAHNFGGGDVFQKIKLAPGDYTFVFQWVDDIYSLNETGGTKNDLDIYLTKSEDGSGLIGFNRDNLIGDPIEFIPISVKGTDSVEYNVFIVNNTPNVSSNLRMKFIVYLGTPRFMEFNEGTATVIGQANAEGAIAVGAARYNHIPGHPFLPKKLENITKPQIEAFSSVGGTWVNGAPRQKPDLVGPDGGNTTVKLGQDYPDWALDGFSNFFGTSAAAPHVAAAAALIIEGRQKFLGVTTTPDQVKSLLQGTAVDMESPGFDYISGSGLVDADSAMRTFATPRPYSLKLVVPTTTPVTIPGETSFLLTVTGENFSETSEIWYGDQKLTTVYISPTWDTIQAYIPTFTDNPEIRVYSAPKTLVPNPLDGGFSNSLYFFDADIVVQAVPTSMKYGQQVPVLDTIITINGKLLQDTTVTLSDIGLTHLKLTTTAPLNANVGTYSITPGFDPNQLPADELLIKYNYKFIDAQLSVAKMPLKVIPNNKTITYGAALGNVTFNYQFDPAFPPANPAQLTDTARLYHQVLLPSNALAVIKNFTKPLIGGYVLSAADLANLNMMVTFNAIKNSRQFTVVNGNLVPATDLNTLNLQYLVDLAPEALYQYKSDPALGAFYGVYPNIMSKGILGATALGNKVAQMQFINASGGPGLASMLNGNLAEAVMTNDGPKAPIINNSRLQVLNSVLVSLNASNQWEPVLNSAPVDLVDNKLAKIINGVPQYLADGETVQLYNGTLVQVNAPGGGTGLAQIINAGGGTGLQQILNTSTLTLANAGGGTGLASILNSAGDPLPDGSLVIFPNGAGLYQYYNGSGGTGLASILNAGGGTGLASILNAGGGTGLASILNAGGGTGLASILNADIIGAGPNQNSNTAVIVDSSNINDPLTGNWLGAMLSINMITGLEVGKQLLVPGILVNPNFDITYGLGEVDIQAQTITIKPDANQSKIYGDQDPVFTYQVLNAPAGVSFTGALSRVAGENVAQGPYAYTVGTLSAGPNYTLTIDQTNKFAITPRAITVTPTPGQSKVYGTADPVFTFTPSEALLPGNNFSGALGRVPGEAIALDFYAYTIGSLSAGSNYTVTLAGTSKFSILDNACLITHNPFTNFGSTANPGTATSLWYNMVTKISGQLVNHGDYLIFTAGTITFNNITSTPTVKNFPIPTGKILADASTVFPTTQFDAATNSWITKVPPGYASTSDIFVSGAIINSSTGFAKKNNGNSVVKGIFYSNKTFKDQWSYAMAAYQPQFTYSQVAAPGAVISINGAYRAGTPTPILGNLVNGASGGGGNNYTGSGSSFDNFTACIISLPIASRSNPMSAISDLSAGSYTQGDIQVAPNPSSDFVTISFVPVNTGASTLTLTSMDGKKLMENNNGICTAGQKYMKRIDVSKLPGGVYLVQLRGVNSTTIKKIIVTH